MVSKTNNGLTWFTWSNLVITKNNQIFESNFFQWDIITIRFALIRGSQKYIGSWVFLQRIAKSDLWTIFAKIFRKAQTIKFLIHSTQWKSCMIRFWNPLEENSLTYIFLESSHQYESNSYNIALKNDFQKFDLFLWMTKFNHDQVCFFCGNLLKLLNKHINTLFQ